MGRVAELNEEIPLGAQMIDAAPVAAETRRRVQKFAEMSRWPRLQLTMGAIIDREWGPRKSSVP